VDASRQSFKTNLREGHTMTSFAKKFFGIAAGLMLALTCAGGEGKGKGHDKDKGNDKDHPGGFDKGKKKGWRDDYPPGWEKKNQVERAEWHKDLEASKMIVITETEKEAPKPEEKDKLQEAVERMVRKGKEAKQAAKDVVEQVKKGVHIDIILKGASGE
jgi:hypothetical protein